ncbi:unnamed protein product [Bursaphelenchus xylophilus]|uniref:(pine wood nematode) hypothetical protein n=1 Tax=Bursaphelenchus xylophilus TaxID=6326 RepID=A0A1I7SML1_BURXY|nr:unnamed protein product [Bursaphelenchus xylophilus]CAG9130270.1 unnamed protein product [Bursaphelenchus xylophilus]
MDDQARIEPTRWVRGQAEIPWVSKMRTVPMPSGPVLVLLLLPLAIGQPAEKTPSIDPHHYQPALNPCYDEANQPQRCVPDFINAAFNLHVEATNTCGERAPTTYCVQTGHMGLKKVCEVCDARVPHLSHPTTYLTDFNNPDNETWWQSDTMLEGMQYPTSINLTLKLNKAYDITYTRIKFVSPRPESFAIYKKTHSDSEWEPWQYYSGSCLATYKLPDRSPILPNNEAQAICTREFSDISPITGATIAFSTLDGRPSAENFEESEVLQEWVTATEIRITLTRINSYGDEIFRDPRVLRSYYYAISDFAVGGRCKCNGHASECVRSTGETTNQLVCNCKHNTAGVDCEKCSPFHVDRPWRPATSTDANECVECNCNGMANRCFFDEKLYNETGHGGHCIDCVQNTQGPHCEECVPNNYRRPGDRGCTACNCNPLGSESEQCDDNGQCRCKPGVTGQHCDQCMNGFYDFSASGCKDCHCELAGSDHNTPRCSASDGRCACKANVEGQRCDKCKPGYFNLDLENVFGCSPCFCYGHSSVCQQSDGYYAFNESSRFEEGIEQWKGGVSEHHPVDVQWAQLDKAVAVTQYDESPVYFYVPEKFLGDQRFAYNQDIGFTLRVQQGQPQPTVKDIVLVGANGRELSLPIFSQNNSLPNINEVNYRFKLHANQIYQWSPSLREVDFISVLANLTAIKIRGTYGRNDVGFLSNFYIGSAGLIVPENVESKEAKWVESCKCGEGFVGQFCESCEAGYKRIIKFGGPTAKCIKCECNEHSDSCDAESGVCICNHNTDGDNCERCSRGYYGDALNGTPDDCKQCDCPEGGPCMLLPDGTTTCTECPEGYQGKKCDECADEYYGNPDDGGVCKKCECNDNVDTNAVGICDTITGECKKCIHHTTGFNCEKCAPGYWGDALAEPKGDCKPCNCYTPGTKRPTIDYNLLECNQEDGKCDCQPNVIGQYCEKCQEGFFNLTSGNGCESCDCDPIGSLNTTCDMVTGGCQCKAGVTGRKCDQCAPYHFGFGSEGCKPCDCDQLGSESRECDVNTGQCLCKNNVEGRRCDQCSENKYDLRSGCPSCDDCYTLIQKRKNTLNGSITTLRENLDEIQNNPVKVEDSEFDARVSEVKGEVEELNSKAKSKLDGNDVKLLGQVDVVKRNLAEASEAVSNIRHNLDDIDNKAAYVELERQRLALENEAIERELDNAISYVEREGDVQLGKAREAADRFGDKSQKLSELAKESKKLVKDQTEKKDNIEKLAEDASSKSKQALNEAHEAIYGASATSQQIATLQKQLEVTSEKLNNTKELAEEQIREADAIYNEAAQTLSVVEGTKLPDIIPDEIKENAGLQKEESQLSLTDANEKIEEQKETLQDAQRTLAEAADKLREAKIQQEETDRILAEVEKSRDDAKDAFDEATKTWNEAEQSFNSLSDFSQNIDASKAEALRQLEQLSKIQDQIKDAEQITANTEQDIGNANSDANESLQLAQKAREDAKILAEEAEKLRADTTATKTKAEEKKKILEETLANIQKLESTTGEFENQAQSDSEKSTEILRNAIVAETAAKNLQSNFNKSEVQLNNALSLLNSLENVNDEQLEELERLLDEAEKQYAEASLDKLVKEELNKKAEQDKVLLKREVDNLSKQLEKLRNVFESLPTRCLNTVSLEQEGQK